MLCRGDIVPGKATMNADKAMAKLRLSMSSFLEASLVFEILGDVWLVLSICLRL